MRPQRKIHQVCFNECILLLCTNMRHNRVVGLDLELEVGQGATITRLSLISDAALLHGMLLTLLLPITRRERGPSGPCPTQQLAAGGWN
ncbi:hypothetical protein GQ607_015710 [Colletotrichum asianum]|uniref:Uncharacterized protein n=1 Tax=Colletotrichum asianum TaxID=702518 RepID=A0A8H3ZMI5_9PEZI|nr:hypothetical protein GQ607_015710 [Colletotrichum asianum]